MRGASPFAIVILGLTLLGCSVEPLELEGRSCPCVAGYTCDVASNTCLREDVPSDAGVDASPPDSGIVDSDRPDSGSADSGAGDSGGDDGGAPDTGIAPSACADVHAGRLFCDGFEAEDFDAWDGDMAPGTSSLERVSSPVYRGAGALAATVGPAENYAQLNAEVFPVPAPANQWFRAYYFIPDGTPHGIEFHEQTDVDRAYNFILYTRSATEDDFHTHGWSTGRQPLDSRLPQGQWFCLETHLEMGDAGSISVYVDETLVATQSGLDNTTPRGLPVVHAGIAWNDADESVTYYIDEVVADTERIGCD